MTDNDWEKLNSQYLAASLQWLRARLRAAIGPTTAPSSTATDVVQPAKRKWFGSSEPSQPILALPAPATETTETLAQAEAQAAATRDTLASASPPPALVALAQLFGMTSFERDVVLLCAAVELDPAIGSSYATLQRSGLRWPTFSLALQLLSDAAWDALSPYRPLRYLRLVEINQPGATPLTEAALRIDERILNYLKGLNVLDERLALLLTPAHEAAIELAHSQRTLVESATALRHTALEQPPTIQLLGPDLQSKIMAAQAIAAESERKLLVLSGDALPTQRAEVESFARLWARESMLLPIALFIAADELDTGGDASAALHWLLARDLGLAFVSLREAPRRALSVLTSIDVAKPTPDEQHAAWVAALSSAADAEAPALIAKQLAGQFDLNLHDIAQIAAVEVRQQTAGLQRRLWARCRDRARPGLDLLAQRLEPKATWDDLVLPAESLALLQHIVGQVRERYTVYHEWGFARKMNRGLGISALFTGESGTGKTMAAEVLANELELALYRIDLSSVVSKYIGETERNLRKLFDAAEQGGAILFFDEADALFGKRSEVKDSHDRYANIEINYLLQRMESFGGLAILATNVKSALDTAFMRRLRFVVNFQFPGVPERMRIWQRAIPPGVPAELFDLERLARFNLAGGNIHGIALNAAFMAAGRDEKLSLAALLSATRAELRKLEKQINEGDFRPPNARGSV